METCKTSWDSGQNWHTSFFQVKQVLCWKAKIDSGQGEEYGPIMQSTTVEVPSPPPLFPTVKKILSAVHVQSSLLLE